MIRDDSPDLFSQPVSVTVRSTRAKRVPNSLVEIPFMQRPTCTIKEACKASGMGRTKFYELIKGGELQMISVGPPLSSRPGALAAQVLETGPPFKSRLNTLALGYWFLPLIPFC